MASFPQKTNVATAITHRSNLPLSDRHISTTNFMELGVAKIREMVPSESINLRMRSFARLDTMKKPTQGDCIVNSRAYFVPIRVIQSNWDDFKSNLPVVNSSGHVSYSNEVDSIEMIEFVRSFISEIDMSTGSNEYISSYFNRINFDDADNYDFTIAEYDERDGVYYDGYRFSAKGARIFKLLCQLGYAIDFNVQNNLNQHDNYVKSALPLKALLKVYYDHYFPSQYSATSEFYEIKYILDYNGGEEFKYYCDYTVLRRIYDFIDKVCYDSDYFVSAWDNPNTPNIGAVQNDIRIPDISGGQDVATSYVDDGTPVIHQQGSPSTPLERVSQFALTALKSLTDFMKRHQIVGARVLDRYLAQWGIVLPSAKLNRSVYIDNFSQPIIFGDVTSTADTEGANLGSYAGKGVLPEREFSFSYETDEFGYFMILSSVVPVTGYYQGEDRMVSHLTPFDFYTPEFDNVGVQAIGVNELYVPMNSARMYEDPTSVISVNEGVRINSAVFGFTPRYAEYKVGKDKLTGDFRLGSRNTELDSWHLFRNMDDFFAGKNLDAVTHDINFIRGIDSEQYNRIFNYMGDLSDKIKVIHYFDYDVSFPGRKLFDTYEFTDEDKAKKVSVDVGGSKSN